MLRVLMVLEDYGELMFLQTVLKKIGFDVDAIQNPRSLSDSILRMNPDVLVMTAHGKRVKGIDLCKLVKKVRGQPKILLLRTARETEEPDPGVDMWREAPLSAVNLLQAIGELCHLNEQILQEKFQKLKMQEVEQEHARLMKITEIAESGTNKGGETGNFGMSKTIVPPEERDRGYNKFLESALPENHGFLIKQVQEQVKALRKLEKEENHDDLERQRKAFVEHLFRKKS